MNLFILYGVVFANLFLGLLVFKRKRNQINLAFSLMIAFIIMWALSNYYAENTAGSLQVFLTRLTYIAAIGVASFFSLFSLLFPKKNVKRFSLFLIVTSLTATTLIIMFLTRLMIKDVRIIDEHITITTGSLYPLFAVFFVMMVGTGIFAFLTSYHKSSGAQKSQVQYVLLGSFLFALFGSLTNLIIPSIVGSWNISTYGPVFTIFFVGFSAYAIIKHRLMDIRLLVLKSVAYSLLLAIVAGVYISLAYLFLQKYPGIVSPNVLTVIALVVVVFGAFPLRRFIERTTDKIFAKGRYNFNELLSTLIDISKKNSRNIFGLTDKIMKTLSSEMKVTKVAFALVSNPEEVEQLRTFGFKTKSKPFWIKPLKLAMRENKTIVSDELEEDSKEKELLRKSDVEVLVPIKTEIEMEAVLALGEKSSGDMYTLQDIKLLEMFAPQAAIALENARFFKKDQDKIGELKALHKVALDVSSTLDLDEVLKGVVNKAIEVTEAETGSLMLLSEEGKILSIRTAKGIDEEIIKKTRLKLGEGVAGWVAEKGEPALIHNGKHENEYLESLLDREGIKSALVVPLKVKGEVIGVLSVNREKKREVFTEENRDLIFSFAAHAAQAIENAKLHEYDVIRSKESIKALLNTVEAKDPYTKGHSEAVTNYAVLMAKEIGFDEKEIKEMETAGHLHDIGKIGIPEAILNKPGRLTEEEREIINQHPIIGANILKDYSLLGNIQSVVLHHHEHFDGQGYPDGQKGKVIPLGARILAVADAFDAMISDRPYRPALSLEEAIEELKKNSGTQFDPQLVEVFLKVLEENKPLKVIEGSRKNSNLKTNHLKVLAGK